MKILPLLEKNTSLLSFLFILAISECSIMGDLKVRTFHKTDPKLMGTPTNKL